MYVQVWGIFANYVHGYFNLQVSVFLLIHVYKRVKNNNMWHSCAKSCITNTKMFYQTMMSFYMQYFLVKNHQHRHTAFKNSIYKSI